MRDGALAKRVLDVAVAGAALALSAPLLLAASAAIKLESPGPVLFAQTRTGRGGVPIRTLKLRTMVADAERAGPAITAGGDPRITRVGRWLRKTKLDELPQLWNIVCGEMSLVGPRPEVPRYTETYPPEWQELFAVRPGLTDPASLTFHDEESLLASAGDREKAYTEILLPMKVQLSLEGVKNQSVRHDLAVLVRTLLVMLRTPDARVTSVLAEARRRIDDLNKATTT